VIRLALIAVAVLGALSAAAAASPARLDDPCAGMTACGYVTVALVGVDPASGTVMSSPAGIDCRIVKGTADPSTSCSALFRSAVLSTINVTLTGVPETGSECVTAQTSKTTGQCFVYNTVQSICGACNVNAKFAFLVERFALTVTKSGQGAGVVSSPAGINCGATCGASNIAYGTEETLTAAPDAGAVFTGWTGACVGQLPTCVLDIDADTVVNVGFGLVGASTTTTTTTTASTTTATTTVTTTTPPTTVTSANTTPTTASTPQTGTTPATVTSTSPATVHQLEAQLIAVKPGKSRLGLRVGYVEIQAGETINATLILSRHGTRLAHASIPDIHPGDRVLTLPIPGSVANGKATLTITLTDKTTNHHTWTRGVNVPK
jgi:hypothetical protein